LILSSERMKQHQEEDFDLSRFLSWISLWVKASQLSSTICKYEKLEKRLLFF
jgi:hypothetical protein